MAILQRAYNIWPTVYHPLSPEINILSHDCVYSLLATKTQSEYEELLLVVVDKCRQLGHQPNPYVVVSDFEVAVIRAVSDVLESHVTH